MSLHLFMEVTEDIDSLHEIKDDENREFFLFMLMRAAEFGQLFSAHYLDQLIAERDPRKVLH